MVLPTLEETSRREERDVLSRREEGLTRDVFFAEGFGFGAGGAFFFVEGFAGGGFGGVFGAVPGAAVGVVAFCGGFVVGGGHGGGKFGRGARPAVVWIRVCAGYGKMVPLK